MSPVDYRLFILHGDNLLVRPMFLVNVEDIYGSYACIFSLAHRSWFLLALLDVCGNASVTGVMIEADFFVFQAEGGIALICGVLCPAVAFSPNRKEIHHRWR